MVIVAPPVIHPVEGVMTEAPSGLKDVIDVPSSASVVGWSTMGATMTASKVTITRWTRILVG